VTVASVESSSIQLEDGRRLPAGYRQFTHGYAVTAHRSQGKTVDFEIIAAERMAQDLFYVSATRAREGLTVITSDSLQLQESIGISGDRQSATELARRAAMVEWYGKQGAPHTLLDLDTENKARGSLAHYFPRARKVNIHTSEGLDAFVDVLDGGAPIVIADMGAGAGAVAHRWFDSMFNSVEEAGVAFTAIGIVTPDPASVESVLAWAGALQHRVQYLIVKNSLTDPAQAYRRNLFGELERVKDLLLL
jgi:hypothetical protein